MNDGILSRTMDTIYLKLGNKCVHHTWKFPSAVVINSCYGKRKAEKEEHNQEQREWFIMPPTEFSVWQICYHH